MVIELQTGGKGRIDNDTNRDNNSEARHDNDINNNTKKLEENRMLVKYPGRVQNIEISEISGNYSGDIEGDIRENYVDEVTNNEDIDKFRKVDRQLTNESERGLM